MDVVPAATAVVEAPAPRARPATEPVPEIIVHERRQMSFSRGKLLGQGGFAKVYEATDCTSGRRYAVKAVDKRVLAKSNSTRQKLISEISIHRSMRHPNIVGYMQHFEDDHFVYILLELCEGKTLYDIVKKRKGMSEREAAYYMLQIIDAVAYMHTNNVIHRDLKLGNVFLSRSGKVKIGDFGLATVVHGQDDRKTTFCGTPNYIAPEVLAQNGGHSFEVDVWSLGVILYTLVFGKPPFETTKVEDTYERIRNTEYYFPEGAPADLQDVVSWLLQRDPKDRPSLRELQEHPFFERTRGWTPAEGPQPSPYSLASVGVSTEKAAPTRRALGDLDNGAWETRPSTAAAAKKAAEPLSKPTNPSPLVDVSNKSAMKEQANAEEGAVPSATREEHRRSMREELRASLVKDRAAGSPRKQQLQQPQPEPEPEPQPEDVEEERTEPIGAVAAADAVPATAMLPTAAGVASPVARSQAPARSSPISAVTAAVIRAVSPNVRAAPQRPSMLTLYRDAVALLEEMHSCPGRVTVTPDDVLTGTAREYVSKWVDYSDKYGFGYQLSSGTVGVFTNDNMSIVMPADQERFQLFDHRTAVHVWFPTSNPPADVAHRLTLLRHFKTYMQEKLLRDSPQTPLSATDAVKVTKWMRTRHAIFFRLSNGMLQVNFFDHTKVMIDTTARSVRFVDQNRRREMWTLGAPEDSAVAGSRVATPQCAAISRIRYAKDLISQLIAVKQRAATGVRG